MTADWILRQGIGDCCWEKIKVVHYCSFCALGAREKFWLENMRFLMHKRRNGSDGNIGVYYGVAFSLSWSNSTRNLETGTTGIWGLRRLLPPFKGKHLKWFNTHNLVHIYLPQGQGRRFPHGWLKLSVHLTPRLWLVWWSIGGKVCWKSSARKGTHSNTIPAFGGLM